MPQTYRARPRPHLPRRPITDDVRARVEAALATGATEGTIVNELGVSRRTVQRFRKNMRIHGNSRPEKDGEKRGRKPTITEEIANQLLEWVDAQEIDGRSPTMDAAMAYVEERWQMRVGRGAVAAALRRVGWTGPRRKGREGDAWGVFGDGGLAACLIGGLSAHEGNVVFSFVKDVEKMEERLASLGIEGAVVVEADIESRDSLKRAARRAGEEMAGKMEGLIVCLEDSGVGEWRGMREFEKDPEVLEADLMKRFNVEALGTYRVFSTFMTLIKKGQAKKMAFVSNSMADYDWSTQLQLPSHVALSASKAAANMVLAKFQAAYGKEGVLCVAISPGMVDKSVETPMTIEDIQLAQPTMSILAQYAPHFLGPISPQTSATMCLKVLEEASLEKGYGGAFLSHYGNRQWL